MISEDNKDDLLASVVPPQDPQGVLDLLILYVGAKSTTFVESVAVSEVDDYPIAFARNSEECVYCIQLGIDSGLIKAYGNKIRLTVKGWQRFNQLRSTRKDSSQAFVAMSFASELDSAWKKGFKPAFKQTGYDPLRIDLKEFNDQIDDHLIAEIRRSGLVVADLTGHSDGVIFEVGFALDLGLQIIWTCKEDDYGGEHFDIRQFKFLLWQDAGHLKKRLVDRIEATGLARVGPTAGPNPQES